MATKDKPTEDLATADETPKADLAVAIPEAPAAPMGFEDEEQGDMIIPRVKVMQTLSPEVRDRTAEEGDIINSLTGDKLNGKTFIPVFKFNNHIWWRDRSEGGGILCMARDGKHGVMSDGTNLVCNVCRKCEFDNTKQGKEALPVCTKYINFFGFFEGERLPIIMSFSKTNYNEGKKLYSLAKVTMQNMWNYGYAVNEKKQAKSGNEWFVMQMAPAGPTSEEDRSFAEQMYKSFRGTLNDMKYDMDEAGPSANTPVADTDASEF